jgi:SAM-dependent methyltransferase
MDGLRESVSEFYGKTVSKTDDLLYSACCTEDYNPADLKHVTQEVLDKRYGCESPIPALLDGRTLIDLGSGAGPDCFIAAKRVGAKGRVVGVDMTPALLEIARRNIDPIMKNLGYAEPNVEFREGHIEKLPIDDDYTDVVISNCVINLSPHKEDIFKEVWRVLKPGGEFFISDIVADRRIPDSFDKDQRLHSECYTGAAYIGDLRQTMKAAGFANVRTVKSRAIDEVIEGVHFESVILRGFKIDLEEASEDYGQVAVYLGTIEDQSNSFTLDTSNVFEAGVPKRVCKNTADILTRSRYSSHFKVSEEMFHMGKFKKETAASQPDDVSDDDENCC